MAYQQRSSAAAVRKNHRFTSIEQRIIKLLGWNDMVNQPESPAVVNENISPQENSVAENDVSAPPSNRIHFTRATGEGNPFIQQQKVIPSIKQPNDKDASMMRLLKSQADLLFSLRRSLIVLEKESIERTRYMQKTAEVKDEYRRSKLKLIKLQTDIASRQLLQMDKTNCQCAAREQKMDSVDSIEEKEVLIEDEAMDIIRNQETNSRFQPTDSDCQSVSEKNFSDDTSCIKLELEIENGFLQNDDSGDISYIKFDPSDEHGFFHNDDKNDNRDEFVNNQRFVQRTGKTPTPTNKKIRSKKRKFEEHFANADVGGTSVPASKLQQQHQSDKEEREISLLDPLGD